jgi:hypothetical protein
VNDRAAQSEFTDCRLQKNGPFATALQQIEEHSALYNPNYEGWKTGAASDIQVPDRSFPVEGRCPDCLFEKGVQLDPVRRGCQVHPPVPLLQERNILETLRDLLIPKEQVITRKQFLERGLRFCRQESPFHPAFHEADICMVAIRSGLKSQSCQESIISGCFGSIAYGLD